MRWLQRRRARRAPAAAAARRGRTAREQPLHTSIDAVAAGHASRSSCRSGNASASQSPRRRLGRTREPRVPPPPCDEPPARVGRWRADRLARLGSSGHGRPTRRASSTAGAPGRPRGFAEVSPTAASGHRRRTCTRRSHAATSEPEQRRARRSSSRPALAGGIVGTRGAARASNRREGASRADDTTVRRRLLQPTRRRSAHHGPTEPGGGACALPARQAARPNRRQKRRLPGASPTPLPLPHANPSDSLPRRSHLKRGTLPPHGTTAPAPNRSRSRPFGARAVAGAAHPSPTDDRPRRRPPRKTHRPTAGRPAAHPPALGRQRASPLDRADAEAIGDLAPERKHSRPRPPCRRDGRALASEPCQPPTGRQDPNPLRPRAFDLPSGTPTGAAAAGSARRRGVADASSPAPSHPADDTSSRGALPRTHVAVLPVDAGKQTTAAPQHRPGSRRSRPLEQRSTGRSKPPVTAEAHHRPLPAMQVAGGSRRMPPPLHHPCADEKNQRSPAREPAFKRTSTTPRTGGGPHRPLGRSLPRRQLRHRDRAHASRRRAPSRPRTDASKAEHHRPAGARPSAPDPGTVLRRRSTVRTSHRPDTDGAGQVNLSSQPTPAAKRAPSADAITLWQIGRPGRRSEHTEAGSPTLTPILAPTAQAANPPR
jgi:hypothetical protein